MSKHHLVITGTGRAGTTFLIQLYTLLGLPTGFSSPSEAIYENCNAGMERDIQRADAPYILKSPQLCDYLDELLERGDIVVDHAIVPVRDLYSAAESRRAVNRRSDPSLYTHQSGIPGGLWHTTSPEHQETALTTQLYKLVFTLAKRDIPTTLLHFPRFIHDPEYLYAKLRETLIGIEYERFLTAFRQVAHPELVHEFVAPVPRAIAAKS